MPGVALSPYRERPLYLLRADERPVKGADIITRVKMTTEELLDDRSPIGRRVVKGDGSDSRSSRGNHH
jgi:hypothetical protein